MAVKVVQGLVGKPDLPNQTNQAATTVTIRAAAEKASASSAVQQSFSKIAASSDAVISTLRAVKAPGNKEGIKDVQEAESKAEQVAERIRDDKEEAFNAHNGLDGVKSGSTLVS